MDRILLNDLLNFKYEDFENIRIRFNQSNGKEDPIDLYLRNPEIANTQWFLWRGKKKHFKKGQIAICLLKKSDDTWLLTTIKRILKDLDIENGINYEAEEVEEFRKYFGRIVIRYHKEKQAMCYRYESICDDLEVLEILPSPYDGEEFSGYDSVRLSYSQLENIIKREKLSWVRALENQKTVYLITDKSNGKLYVGSATSGSGMLLSRWRSYIENGHGGNVELKEVVLKKGFEYVKKNFQYSILENYNSRVDDDYILSRESWWKETLKSREFGYNSN